ncbi:hypothetical protein [Paenirhodobacter enshiensis]|uniref:Short-chain dehydrogenase n=1 Tax=Paenirhodobacter enshiensis TaxID=1105367 RepID=A0A086XRV6_9RHOB|nr:hypothetical protein [Paenirhodobacter enshiensis]KFI24756.1 short-chain dehydrogenase [Paenirhodobacter enshiensis]
MLIKIMLLFLGAMALLAMVAKALLPKVRSARGRCPACGRPKIGPGPCPCGKH